MSEPLPPQYSPQENEDPLYRWWEEQGYFRADAHSAREPYVIVIPPPNVTAVLHMGHGLNNTVQDVLVRFERMQGREALWMPGTDHAGIATQNVVERMLAKEGRRATTWAASRSWSGCGSSWTRRAAPSSSSCAPSAARWTGAARASRWTRSFPRPCARCSCACTRRGSSTAATASSTGARAA